MASAQEGSRQAILPGAVIENPALRLRSTVLELSGEVLRSETEVGPCGNGGPLHRHLRQEERFLVQEGTLRIRRGLWGSRLVRPGEEAVIEPGTPHTFKAEGEGARFITEFRPPWKVAEFFQELFGLAIDGRLDKHGNPKLTDLAVLMQKYPEDFFYAPIIPPGLQRMIARLLVKHAARRTA